MRKQFLLITPNIILAETSIIKIPNQEPKKLGYTFEGWKTGTDDTVYKYGTQNDTYTVPNDINGAITFIAQWSINEYEITYELNGGIKCRKMLLYRILLKQIR